MKQIEGGRQKAEGRKRVACRLPSAFRLLLSVFSAFCFLPSISYAAFAEPPPNPGMFMSIRACDVIVDADIVAGGPFRAAAFVRKAIKGDPPKFFELQGFNSFNWDTVHHGFPAGSRYILFLSRTGNPDVYATLTPSAPRLSVHGESALIELGEPPFRIPVKRSTVEEAIKLVAEHCETGAIPSRAEEFLRGLWDEGELEARYLSVAVAGELRDRRVQQLAIDASKDKIQKLRLTGIEALGQIASPETINALLILIKDDKASTSREAAHVLTNLRQAELLPDLLEWSRRVAVAKVPTGKTNDTNRVKNEAAATEIIRFAAEAGYFLDTAAIARPLFDIARGSSDTLAREALLALGAVAKGPQIAGLLELAEDHTYDQHTEALNALRWATLKKYDDESGFRSWWTDAGSGFGDEMLRDTVKAAFAGLSDPDTRDRRELLDQIRKAPAALALPIIAPMLLKSDSDTDFGADDLVAWHSPLTLPFLIERLGRERLPEQHAALDGLIKLSARNPRLKTLLWPLIRASLADEDNASRRQAQTACGTLGKTDGMLAILDSLNPYYPRWECQDAGKAAYACTARTMGFAINEPLTLQNEARVGMTGWWTSAGPKFKPCDFSTARPTSIHWLELDANARNAKLEALLLGADNRASGAAFTMLYAERAAEDPLWQRMLKQNSERDRAHAMLGMLGSASPEFDKRLSAEETTAFGKALALTGLAAGGGNGPAKVVAWLKGPGAKSDLDWKRMAIVALGLADGDKASLVYLHEMLDAALKDKPAVTVMPKDPDVEDFFPKKDTVTDKAVEEKQLLRPLIIALSARADGTEGLMKVLKLSQDTTPLVMAARALSQRRHVMAIGSILSLLEHSDRSTWPEYSRIVLPMLRPADAPGICALFESDTSSPRCAAAYMLSLRPDVGTDAATCRCLIERMEDHSNVVRYYAAEALGKRHITDALRGLVKLLRDEDTDVRSAAAEAIGLIGDKESCQAVVHAAAFQDRPDIRWLTALAIAGGELYFKQFLMLCNSNLYPEQQAGLEAMGASDRPEALAWLLKTFHDDDAMLQTEAMEALARRGDAAVEAVRVDIQSADKNVRAHAVHLLSRINTRTSRSLLQEVSTNAAEDPGVKALAEFALKRFGAK